MSTPIGFHFLLLAIGEVLKTDVLVTPQKMQDLITRDDAFGGIRVPLSDCRIALQLMENSGFIVKRAEDKYYKCPYVPPTVISPDD
jgi:hypothetical protein